MHAGSHGRLWARSSSDTPVEGGERCGKFLMVWSDQLDQVNRSGVASHRASLESSWDCLHSASVSSRESMTPSAGMILSDYGTVLFQSQMYGKGTLVGTVSNDQHKADQTRSSIVFFLKECLIRPLARF